MGNYTPDWPTAVGMQWAPLIADQVRLDPYTEIGHLFRGESFTAPPGTLTYVNVSTPVPPGQTPRGELQVAIYNADEVDATGALRTVTVPCTAVGVQSGGSLVGGPTKPADAVRSPADGLWVALTGPNAACRFGFDATIAPYSQTLSGRRIIDVSVLYAVSGPFDTQPALNIGLERPSANVVWPMDILTGPTAATGLVQLGRSRWGDLNPWWSPTLAPMQTGGSTPVGARMPWTMNGSSLGPWPYVGLDALTATGNGALNVRISTAASVPAGTVFQIHYLALLVTFGQENRVAAGGQDISSGVQTDGTRASYRVPIWDVHNFGRTPILTPGNRYAITVSLGNSGPLGTSSPVPVVVDRLGTVGDFPNHRGIVVRKTIRPGTIPQVQRTPLMPALVPAPMSGHVETGAHGYCQQLIGTCHQMLNADDIGQQVVDDVAGTYAWAQFYARHLPGTIKPLNLCRLDPTTGAVLATVGVLDVNVFDALPEQADGWRKVTLRLDPPVQLTGGGGVAAFGWTTGAPAGTAWQILGADTNPLNAGGADTRPASYGGATATATVDGTADPVGDLALSLIRDLDPVTGLTVTTQLQPLPGDAGPCDTGAVGAVPDGVWFHRLAWDAINSDMVRGWNCYEIARQDDTMPADTWETVGLIGEPTVTTMDDHEARIGVASRYRIRAVHRTGVTGPWSAPVTATLPAPNGTTGAGVLVLGSNHDPDRTVAYRVTGERGSSEDFTFPEAAQLDLQAVYGRDYRLASHPTERGGVEFTRTLITGTQPTGPGRDGFAPLRDLAWAPLPYVCVRDELGNRWLAALQVPSGQIRRRGRTHLHLAQLGVAEVTATPAPITGAEPACEGLRPDATGSITAAATGTLDAWAPVTATDAFDRDVAAGWGSTGGGPVWTQTDGSPFRASVSGGAGRMLLAQTRNSNPYFETNTTGWTATGGTVTRTTTLAHQGSACLLLTPSGTAATVRVDSEIVDGVTASATWRAAAWVRSPIARTVTVTITWYDQAGTVVATNSSSTALTANTWTRLEAAGNASGAAATAVRASMSVSVTGTPTAAQVLYVDEAILGPASSPVQMLTALSQPDVDVRMRFRADQAAVGAAYRIAVAARAGTNASGAYGYRGVAVLRPDGTVAAAIERVDAGTATAIGAETAQLRGDDTPLTWTPGGWLNLIVTARGPVLSATVHADGPQSGHTLYATDTTYPAAGQVGVRAALAGGSQNADATVAVDTVTVRQPNADLDVRFELRPTGEDPWTLMASYEALAPTPGGGWYILAGCDISINPYQACTYVGGTGTSITACATSQALAITTRQRRWVRITYQQNVAGKGRISYFTSLDGATWTAAGSTDGSSQPAAADSGKWYLYLDGPITLARMQWRAGIDGPPVADVDFEHQPPSATGFTDATGNPWTVDGRGICA